MMRGTARATSVKRVMGPVEVFVHPREPLFHRDDAGMGSPLFEGHRA